MHPSARDFVRWGKTPLFPRHSPLLSAPFALVSILTAVWWLASSFLPHSFLSYSTRPLWDRPESPTELLTHFEAAGVPPDCALHGWTQLKEPREVWDAVRPSLC